MNALSEIEPAAAGAPATAGPDLSRRAVIAGGALLATTALAEYGRPRIGQPRLSTADLQRRVPQRIGAWNSYKGDEIVMPRSELSAQTYDGVVTRSYEAKGFMPVMMLIAYGGSYDGMFNVHDPETCYPGAGFKIDAAGSFALPLGAGAPIEARYVSAHTRYRAEQLIYWIRIGDDFPFGSLKQRWAITKFNLRGQRPDGALVRLSCLTDDLRAAMPSLRAFAHALVHDGGDAARLLVAGPAIAAAMRRTGAGGRG